MGNIQNRLQLQKLCDLLQLGEIVRAPEAVSGGLLHGMYAIETTQGKYAVKALNPQIMLRPAAKGNYIRSERIAAIAANQVPAVPAKRFNGAFMHEIDNQFYLVFDWVEGKSLRLEDIEFIHCRKIAAVLATLHMTDFSGAGFIIESAGAPPLTDWNRYLRTGQEQDASSVNRLPDMMDKLYDWDARAGKSASLLVEDTVISHGDLDAKNVLWNGNNPVLIDWESAGPINPMHDLVETAVYWSSTAAGYVDKDKFVTFIGAYKEKRGSLKADWRLVLDNGFLGKLGWLEYNLKRSLGIECSTEEERQIGTAQVSATLDALIRYEESILEIGNWLEHEI